MRTTVLAAILLAILATACKKEEKDPPCSYTVGAWSAWSNGFRTRTVTPSSPDCTVGSPATIEEHPCVLANKGWLTIRNNSTNPYSVSVTGPTTVPTFTLAGNTQRDSIYLGTGNYELYALQLSGYVVFPSEFNGTASMASCNDLIWSFP